MAATVTPFGTPGTVSTVTITAGVPTAGSGTVSTLDNIFNATNGPIDVKAASTLPAATDKALVATLRDAVTISSSQLAPLISSYVAIATTNAQQVALPTDQVVSNKVQAQTNGMTPSRVNAAASTNATSLKASAGAIGSIDVFNVAAYDVFLKLYNKASAPTVGTDTPIWTIPIKTGTGYSRTFPYGKWFSTGVAYAITKLQADSDTTVLVAGDVTGSIDWI